jgi:hypothetical protein
MYALAIVPMASGYVLWHRYEFGSSKRSVLYRQRCVCIIDNVICPKGRE